MKVPKNASIVGRRIGELLLPQQSLITLIIDSEGTPRVPGSDTVIRAEDQIVAVTRRESEDALRSVLTNSSSPGAYGVSG